MSSLSWNLSFITPCAPFRTCDKLSRPLSSSLSHRNRSRFLANGYSQRRRCTSVTAKAPSANSCETEGIRINKCFKSFASRRESDAFIEAGRVCINGSVAHLGARVFSGDRVEFDGRLVQWERLALSETTDTFVYLKHWKATDVICTTDESITNNIIQQIPHSFRGQDRIFPIGRLDSASTGLILLSSDGRLPGALLGAGKNCSKEYLVVPDKCITDDDLEQLRNGVVISTVAHRDRGVRKKLTAPTFPCDVWRESGSTVLIRLQEGRNRQIRKMLGALGYTTRAIHRVGFMGITLEGLNGPGDVEKLNEREMALVEEQLRKVQDEKLVST